jgi:hypothetical protein
LKLLQEKLWKTLKDIGIGNYFLNRTPINQEIRARIDKWNCIKLKNFCISKEKVTRIKRQPTEWETVPLMDRGLVYRMYKELKKLNSKRTSNPINKWVK